MKLSLNSLRFKISVLALLILAAILVLYSGFLFFSLRYMLYQNLDSALTAKSQKIQSAVTAYLGVLGNDRRSFEFSVNRVIAQTGSHPHKNKIDRLESFWRGQSEPGGLARDYVEFLDPKGRVMARSNSLRGGQVAVSPQDIQAALKGRSIFRNMVRDKEPLRVMLAPAVFKKLEYEKNYVIVIASSRENILDVLREIFTAKAVLISLILIIASGLSQLFAKRVLKPIQEITKTAKNINYKDLSVRIKAEEVDVEMKDLVDSLNEMMSRLERSFQYIAEFSSHVSHELKTPLAILRGESELALRVSHTPEELRNVIKGNLEEIARMSKIIDDLLLLTKLDYQPQVFKLDVFDLTEFFSDISESVAILADEKNITVDIVLPKEPMTIAGDKVHLRRLFFNLINNAIKFTPACGKFTIRMRRQDGSVLVSFKDSGVGIPEENLSKVFDKFFHYNSPAVNAPSGNGLGLSLARSIAKVHGGDIGVESRQGEGATFTVRLPLQK